MSPGGAPPVPRGKEARRAQARRVVRALAKLYPDAHCELDYGTPFQLLVAVILSAQCTDKRVNLVTKELFKTLETPKDFAEVPLPALEKAIRSTGFFRNKAANIKGTAKALLERHGGKVPRTMEELLALPGVARKTANVILGEAHGISEGIVVDTHVKRLSYRLGLADASDPVKVERELVEVVPRKDWILFGHRLIWHGRRVCFARSPDCPGCAMRGFCPKRGV